MRIPTLSQFIRQAENLSRQYDQLRNLQEQVYTGNKIVKDSDDPVLAGQVKSVDDAINRIESYSNNASLAKARSEVLEDSVRSGISSVSRIQNIILQVQNGTIKESDRQNLAKSLRGDLNTLLNIANQRDANGQYVFSGYNTNSPPYIQNGSSYVYQGGTTPTEITIGQNVSAIFNESGHDVFGDIRLGNGKFTITAGSGNTGSATTSAGQVVDSSAYVADTYTVTFLNDGGILKYSVVGASSGQVIPAPPGTVPTDAPIYTAKPSGTDVTFNGMTLNIKGQPAVGDTFTVAQSTTQNVFDTVEDIIDLLENPVSNQGQYDQAIRQAAASMQQVFDHFVNYQSGIGTRSAAIDEQIKTNQKSLNDKTTLRGFLLDADLVTVFSKLSQQSLALQATQSGYLKIQETFSNLLRL